MNASSVCVCVCVCDCLVFLSSADKSPLLTEFILQIKSNTDTSQLFESIKADATLTVAAATGVERMDLS